MWMLSSLDFSSNCTDVWVFLQSWFDLSHYKDVGSMPGHEYNVTFWVPATVDATTTATYFREALSSDLQAVASYGEILEWERLLGDVSDPALDDLDFNFDDFVTNLDNDFCDKLSCIPDDYEPTLPDPWTLTSM
jgi:hypothetical protein